MPVTNKSDSFSGMSPVETKSAKKFAKNSWRYTRADGAQVTRLHMTDVVVCHRGQVTFNANGWRTVTTKDRMNSTDTGFSVYSEKGRWFVRERATGRTVEYFDGITLPKDFGTGKADKAAKREDKTLKLIESYVAKVRALDVLPHPNGGDCWLCMMFNANIKVGEQMHDPEHLLSHLREGYIFGSLFVVAMKWAGYQDAGIAFWFNQYASDKRHMLRTLRRFLKAQLGVGGR